MISKAGRIVAAVERHAPEARDRARAQRLAYGAVQRRGTCDHIVSELADLGLMGIPILVAIGLRSYAMYLVHWPIIVFTRPGVDTPLTGLANTIFRVLLIHDFDIFRWILCGDGDEAIRKCGLDWATQQCRDLLDNNVRGIHFYTMNKATATVEIYRRLGATTSEDLGHLAGL